MAPVAIRSVTANESVRTQAAAYADDGCEVVVHHHHPDWGPGVLEGRLDRQGVDVAVVDTGTAPVPGLATAIAGRADGAVSGR
jgi:hypothetical protein